MLHRYLADAKFWGVLLRIDEDLASQVRSDDCPHCRGVLHSARYPRKPRGVARAVLGADYWYRLSLCCAREGCRRRTTPPSVRFLGRRMYLGALVVLVSALTQGLNGRRRDALCERFGISTRTIGRWRRWWGEVIRHRPVYDHETPAASVAATGKALLIPASQRAFGRRVAAWRGPG